MGGQKVAGRSALGQAHQIVAQLLQPTQQFLGGQTAQGRHVTGTHPLGKSLGQLQPLGRTRQGQGLLGAAAHGAQGQLGIRGRQALAFEPGLGGQRLRPLICYEDLFGEDVVASALDQGEAAATVFVNASNLAWFGPRMVQDQHLQFSQMRALEFQRPVVRSTNTGATALVDHRGQVLARLPVEQQGVLEVEVRGRRGETPYARWLSRLQLWPLWGLALLGLACGLLQARKRGPFQG